MSLEVAPLRAMCTMCRKPLRHVGMQFEVKAVTTVAVWRRQGSHPVALTADMQHSCAHRSSSLRPGQARTRICLCASQVLKPSHNNGGPVSGLGHRLKKILRLSEDEISSYGQPDLPPFLQSKLASGGMWHRSRFTQSALHARR